MEGRSIISDWEKGLLSSSWNRYSKGVKGRQWDYNSLEFYPPHLSRVVSRSAIKNRFEEPTNSRN